VPTHSGQQQDSAETRRGLLSPGFSLAFVVVIAAAIYLGTAGNAALLDDADASHALVAREMLQRGDWAVMYMNGIRWLMKAPLHYWMVAAAYATLGVNEFATRLPVALAMIGLAAMTFVFARRFFGARAGLYSGLAMATCVGGYIFTRIMIPEAIYALLFTAIFYLFLVTWQGKVAGPTLSPKEGERMGHPDHGQPVKTPHNQQRVVWGTRLGYWACAALTGLAVLTRGLIGVIFPVGVIALFVLLTDRFGEKTRRLPVWSSLAVFLAVAAPWHVIAGRRAPGFFFSYFINEHFLRATGMRYPPDYESVPLVLWWGLHLVWLFPWSIFAGLVVGEWFRESTPPHNQKRVVWGTLDPRTWRALDDAGQARLLLFLWAGCILVFFSVVTGSRMEYYAFGAWPALAILLGSALAQAEERGSVWAPRLQAGLAVLGAAIAAVLGFEIWRSLGVEVHGDITSLLETHPNDFYRLSMAHTLDLTARAFAALRGPAAGAAVALGAGFGVAWWLRRGALGKGPTSAAQMWGTGPRGVVTKSAGESPASTQAASTQAASTRVGGLDRNLAATVVMALAMVGFIFSANAAYQTFEPHMSSRRLARAIVPWLRAQDAIVIYGEFDPGSSVAFYTRRQALLFNGRYNNLEPGSYYPDAPHIFLDDHTFPPLWASERRVFLFVQPEVRSEAMVRLSEERTYVLAESGGKSVYVNQRLTPEMLSLAEVNRHTKVHEGSTKVHEESGKRASSGGQ